MGIFTPLAMFAHIKAMPALFSYGSQASRPVYRISHFAGNPQGPLLSCSSVESSGPAAFADVVPAGALDSVSFVPFDACSWDFGSEAVSPASQAKLTLETA